MAESCATPTMNLTGFLRDFRGAYSWGRFCAVACLGMAVTREFMGADIAHVALWLSAALGNYGASKVTEMITAKRVTETGGDQ